jgi:hypothetical protein
MNKFVLTTCALLLCATLAKADPPRDAEAIWKDYQAVKMPTLDRDKISDQAYLRTYIEARQQALVKQNELALEFFKANPKDRRAMQLMLARWRNMSGADSATAEQEMADLIKETSDPKLKADVLYQRAMMSINTARPDIAKARGLTDEFIQAEPQDERGASLLTMLAMRATGDENAQRKLYERILADNANSSSAKIA